MPGPLTILFAAGFTLFVLWRIGGALVDRITAPLSAIERHLFAAIAGAPVLGLIVFLCCVLHLARTVVFLIFGLALVALSYLPRIRTRPRLLHFPRLSRAQKLVFGIPWITYLIVYLSNSLAPEMSPDGAAYHLGLVYRYFRQAGFERYTTNMYEYFPKGMEMLYLFAFGFGGRAAAATIHAAFLVGLPLLMLSYARRIGRPWAGICAGMLVYLSPVMGIDGVSAYTDVALATAAFALFHLIEIWRAEPESDRDLALLVAAGLIAGFCFAIKFTGAAAILYIICVILSRRRFRALAPVLACAALIVFPWPFKNWLWTGNPAAPFFNRLFPNPYIHVSFETTYRSYFATYNLPEYKSLPWRLAVSGELGGQIGPLFLLAPLAVFSARSPEGRRCLLALLFFLLPYPANIGARFLIPALPFIALAMAIALDFSRALLITLVFAATILAWPRVIRHYRAPAGTWEIATVPWQAALGLIAPERYLEQRSAEYRIARMIDANVPPDRRLWSTSPVAESYERPDVLVSYQSAEGELIEDILATAIETDRQPLWNLRFTFTPQPMRSITFEQMNRAQNDIWSIGEIRFFLRDSQVRPRITSVNASPFPWDAAFAIDGNPLTRWKAWQSIRSGMTWSAEFDSPVTLDRAELHCAHDQWAIDVRIRGIPAKLEKLEDAHCGDLRPLAAHTVKSRGIDYLLTNAASRLDPDLCRNPSAWKVTPIAATDGAHLYRID